MYIRTDKALSFSVYTAYEWIEPQSTHPLANMNYICSAPSMSPFFILYKIAMGFFVPPTQSKFQFFTITTGCAIMQSTILTELLPVRRCSMRVMFVVPIRGNQMCFRWKMEKSPFCLTLPQFLDGISVNRNEKPTIQRQSFQEIYKLRIYLHTYVTLIDAPRTKWDLIHRNFIYNIDTSLHIVYSQSTLLSDAMQMWLIQFAWL